MTNEHDAEKEIFKAMPMPNNIEGSSPTLINLRCTNCGGTMQIKEKDKVICCPYCQSKTMVINDSPTEVYKEVEIEKMHTYERITDKREQADMEKRKQNLKESYHIVLVYILVCLGFILLVKLTDWIF